ncbi:MAG: DNRLRE domain-containing protein, partial [Fibrobacterota bacterium]
VNGYVDSIMVSVTHNRVVRLVSVEDAYVRDGTYASQNFGSLTSLVIKTGGTSYSRYSFLKFDLSGLPADSLLLSAKLRIYALSNNLTGPETMPLTVYKVADNSWSENVITWTNKPAAGQPVDTLRASSAVSVFYTWDVMPVFADSAIGAPSTLSFCVKDPASTDKLVDFASRENETGKPVLELVFSGEVTLQEEMPDETGLLLHLAIFPNPFNPISRVTVFLTKDTFVRLHVYNISGKLIRTISEGRFNRGAHPFIWDGRDDVGNPVSSGIYLVKVFAGGNSILAKGLLLR